MLDVIRRAALLAGLLAGLFAHAQTPVVTFEVKAFEVEGDNPLTAAQTEAALAGFIGQHEGLERVLDASKALEQSIRADGHAFHRVILEPQALTEGVVKLRVIAYAIAKVTVEGNDRFSDENIRRSLPAIETGASVNTGDIGRTTRFANQHPAKRIKLAFSDSQTEGGIDARIRVEEERPWGLFASLDNTGSEETGRTRVSVGASHSNLFDRDHQLSASYTTSPEKTSRVRQIGASYAVPWYEQSTRFAAFIVDSDVDSGEISGFDVSGAGRFAGLSATRTLTPHDAYSHAITLSVQDKRFESDVVPLGGNTSVFPAVRSRPLGIGYSGSYAFEQGELSFHVDYARNLPGGGANRNSSYAVNRLGADSEWKLWRFGVNLDRLIFESVLARLRFAGQWSSEPLISGEQFGLGGADSIPGFEEREVSGERGVELGVQLWSPPLELPESWEANLRAIASAGWGTVSIDTPAVGQPSNDTLASVGVGLRAQAGPLQATATYAQVLDGGPQTQRGDHKLHFRVVYRY